MYGLRKLYESEYNERSQRDVTTLSAKATLTAIGGDLVGRASAISERKVWSVLARAGGMCALGDQGGWIFEIARGQFKHTAGEESEDEEKDSGPQGCIVC